jgi:hypothetical protein
MVCLTVFHPFKLTHQRPTTHLAPAARILLHQFSDRLQLWRLGDAQPGDAARPAQMLLELKPSIVHHIACAAISPCASLVALSTAAECRLFSLEINGDRVKVTKLATALEPSAAMSFVGISHLVCLSTSGRVQVIGKYWSMITLVGSECGRRDYHRNCPSTDRYETLS